MLDCCRIIDDTPNPVNRGAIVLAYLYRDQNAHTVQTTFSNAFYFVKINVLLLNAMKRVDHVSHNIKPSLIRLMSCSRTESGCISYVYLGAIWKINITLVTFHKSLQCFKWQGVSPHPPSRWHCTNNTYGCSPLEPYGRFHWGDSAVSWSRLQRLNDVFFIGWTDNGLKL